MFAFLRKEDSIQNIDDSEGDNLGSTGEFAPNTQISYKLNLIDTLKAEHRVIENLLDDIELQFKKNSIRKVKSVLLDFRHEYKTHILKEHVLLYTYLRHSTKKHEKLYGDICLSERYIRKLSKKVIKFCDDWIAADASKFKTSFPKSFKKMHSIVTLRNAFEEEKLFKAYREPSAYIQN